MTNEYPTGSPEAEAYALGCEYAAFTGGVYSEPLSGEWADMPSLAYITRTVIRSVLGESATGHAVDVFAEEWADSIADAYEAGYRSYRDERGK